jgi:hypothetical protein
MDRTSAASNSLPTLERLSKHEGLESIWKGVHFHTLTRCSSELVPMLHASILLIRSRLNAGLRNSFVTERRFSVPAGTCPPLRHVAYHLRPSRNYRSVC